MINCGCSQAVRQVASNHLCARSNRVIRTETRKQKVKGLKEKLTLLLIPFSKSLSVSLSKMSEAALGVRTLIMERVTL